MAAGLDNILISYNLLGEEKTGRLGALLRGVNVTVVADNPVVVDGLTRAAAIAGRPLPVAVECDTGRKRAGVETPAEAVALARHIASLPDLGFAGLLLYPPEAAMAAAQPFLDAALAGLSEIGLLANIVSTGGTPNLAHLGELDGVTEHRAGTAIFNDRMMMKAGVAALADCALTVYTTVVSRAAPERGILDAGSKTLTTDTGGLDGFGLILEHPEARIAALSEEHGILDLTACRAAGPRFGDVVRVVPNHVCVVVNMADRYVAVRGEEIIGEVPVAARSMTGLRYCRAISARGVQ